MIRRFADVTRMRVGWLVAVAAAVVVVPSGPAFAQPGGFGDVPEDTYYTVPVSTLAGQGVFAGTGCDEGFCPGDAIDRKTMAVWTVRVLDGEDPAAVAESRFDDVDPHGFHAPFIERMAELGVTQGCGDGSGFCPHRNVSRAHMAAFLSRAYKLPDGPDPGFADVPDDAWYAADVARLAASKITEGCGDGTAFCPSRDTTRAHMATFLWRAENTYRAPEAGVQYVCELGTDGTITCWGQNEYGETDAPSGRFSAVSAGVQHVCGLGTDGTITCWGQNEYGETDAPSGSFSAVTAGGRSCGLRTDGTITCWGNNDNGQRDAPSGSFSAVSAGGFHSCGLRIDGTITCWGQNVSGQRDAPSGSFSAVSAGWSPSCGLATDGTITCWGHLWWWPSTSGN